MRRREQLVHLLRDVVARFFSETVEFKSGTFVTVTRVAMAKNGHAATLFISVLPGRQGAAALKTLTPYLYELQGHVNTVLGRRNSPRIRFALEPAGIGPASSDRAADPDTAAP